MAKKNFVSYGDAETLMSEIADKFDSIPAPTPAPDLSAYETSWTGTQDEWDALDDEEKAKYQIVNITDDSAGGDMAVVDEVTSGNMNPVTSNAVAGKFVIEERTLNIPVGSAGVNEQCTKSGYRIVSLTQIGSNSAIPVFVYLYAGSTLYVTLIEAASIAVTVNVRILWMKTS